MKPWVKRVIGILCHIPGLYMLIFMGFMVWMITHSFGKDQGGPPLTFIIMMICHLLVMLLIFALLAFFVIWLLKGSSMNQESKIIWALATFFLGPIAMPILYWLYLRKCPDGPYFFGGPLS
jgi:hypothetical protein